ncbi:MAG: alkaline phosphatase D family protein [Pseudomonadota bacterium]
MGEEQHAPTPDPPRADAGRDVSPWPRLLVILMPAALLATGLYLVAHSQLLSLPARVAEQREAPPPAAPRPKGKELPRSDELDRPAPRGPRGDMPPRSDLPRAPAPGDAVESPLPGPVMPKTDERPRPESPAAGPPTGVGNVPFPDLRLPEVAPPPPPPPDQPPVPPPRPASTIPSAVPATPWIGLEPQARLTRIGFGSCLSQRHPQPVWRAILAERLDLFLMLGDNVYGDVKSPDLAELAEAYQAQLAHPEFSKARRSLPMLGIWDDHDYGLNDGGGAFVHRFGAARLFREYWALDGGPGQEDGVYYARTFGPAGKRVQIIMLDTRSQRSPFRLKGASFPYWGKYEPDGDPAKTMLGARQWAWLGAELAKPADIRLIVSSIQVLAEGHGFERWGNLPRERERLIGLVKSSGAKGVVLLSGDRHMGALYNRSLGAGRILPEITSSSLNRSYGPSQDGQTPELLTAPYHPENYGVVEIDWDKRVLRLSLKGLDGGTVESLTIKLVDLGLPG